MLLSRLQQLLGGIYDVPVAHDVYDFLVTDRARLPPQARGGTAEEEVLVAQFPGGGELALSLYLDPQLLQRLARADPLECLHAGNVADCLTALEGVSHFMYLAWNAGHDKPVSLLELEMQAEVDKFIASYLLLTRQAPGHFPRGLRRLLFARARPDPRLAPAAELRRDAHVLGDAEVGEEAESLEDVADPAPELVGDEAGHVVAGHDDQSAGDLHGRQRLAVTRAWRS